MPAAIESAVQKLCAALMAGEMPFSPLGGLLDPMPLPWLSACRQSCVKQLPGCLESGLGLACCTGPCGLLRFWSGSFPVLACLRGQGAAPVSALADRNEQGAAQSTCWLDVSSKSQETESSLPEGSGCSCRGCPARRVQAWLSRASICSCPTRGLMLAVLSLLVAAMDSTACAWLALSTRWQAAASPIVMACSSSWTESLVCWQSALGLAQSHKIPQHSMCCTPSSRMQATTGPLSSQHGSTQACTFSAAQMVVWKPPAAGWLGDGSVCQEPIRQAASHCASAR